MSFTSRIEGGLYRKQIHDFVYALFFGVISALFGHIFFSVPNYHLAFTDLREIPLLISVIYIRNPIYLIISCLVSSINIGSEVPFAPTVVMHIIPIFIAWAAYQKIRNRTFTYLHIGLIASLGVVGYYFIFLFPSFILTYEIFGLNDSQSFYRHYLHLVSATAMKWQAPYL